MATEYPATATVRITSSRFASVAKDLRWLRGRYDGSAQTWTVANDGSSVYQRMIDNPHGFGVQIVSTTGATQPASIDTCQLWTREQGCVLHGELCARGRN